WRAAWMGTSAGSPSCRCRCESEAANEAALPFPAAGGARAPCSDGVGVERQRLPIVCRGHPVGQRSDASIRGPLSHQLAPRLRRSCSGQATCSVCPGQRTQLTLEEPRTFEELVPLGALRAAGAFHLPRGYRYLGG